MEKRMQRRLSHDAGKYGNQIKYASNTERIEKTWLNLRRHSDGTIKKPEELEDEMKEPLEHVDSDVLNRIHGSMIGMALGDALGAHVEFRPHEYMAENPVKDLKGGGTWGLEKGQFTDDTSMALCLASSLVVQRDYDPYDQLVRYKWWYREGYMSSTGKCFDIGSATKKSLVEFERRQKSLAKKYEIPFEEVDSFSNPELLEDDVVKCSEDGVAGNGALMRLAPVPLFFHKYPVYAVEYSGHSGEITHGDVKAYDACRYYGALIVAAVNGATRKELLEESFYENHESWFDNKPLHEDIMTIARGSYKREKGYADGIRGKGYIVNALEAALWAFWSDNGSFKDGVLAAVNLGDDTDTTAAIYGQLAGACYGYSELPSKWVKDVYAKDFIKCLSKWIAYEGMRWSPEKSKCSHTPSVTVELPRNVHNKLSFEQKTYSKNPPVPEKSSKNQLQVPTNEPDMASRAKSASNPNTDYPTDSRTRSRTTTDAPDISKASQKLYFHKTIKDSNDVYNWMLKLGHGYEVYATAFKTHNIDGYWLLNHMNNDGLISYGVHDENHRQRILDEIETLKSKCQVTYPQEQR